MLRRPRNDDGSALIIALALVVFGAVLVTALLDRVFSNSGTTPVVRQNRFADYDADAAMEQAIASLRNSTTLGVVGTDCTSLPNFTGLNYTTTSGQYSTYKVECTPSLVTSSSGAVYYYQRHVQFHVYCSTNCPALSPDIRADVNYYDDSGALIINSWSLTWSSS